MLKPKRKGLAGPPKVKPPVSKLKRNGGLPSSEAVMTGVVYLILAMFTLAGSLVIIRSGPDSESSLVGFVAGKNAVTGGVLLLQHLVSGKPMMALGYNSIGWIGLVSVLNVVSKLLFLIGLQSGSFPVCCAFVSLSMLGFGLQSKKTGESSSPEKVVFASVVVGGIIALAIQTPHGIGWIHFCLFASAICFWAFLYLVKFRENLFLGVGDSSLDFYLTCGAAPILAGLFWGCTSQGDYPWFSMHSPFGGLSMHHAAIMIGVAIIELAKTRFAARLVSLSSTRFFVAVELSSYIVFLILGPALSLTAPTSVTNIISASLTAVASISFASKDIKKKVA